jgi:hypothetical protein
MGRVQTGKPTVGLPSSTIGDNHGCQEESRKEGREEEGREEEDLTLA